jgi:hypothetical protein
MNNTTGTTTQTNTIQFDPTFGNDQTAVMRITRDGVWVNPDVSVDDAAKAVLAALDSHIKMLVESAVQAERNKLATWMMQCGFATGHGDTVEELLYELDTEIEDRLAAREWAELTDKEVKDCIASTAYSFEATDIARAVEAKLKEKNT